jgi:pyruvate ferredoxin oxidoreductase beta subunit
MNTGIQRCSSTPWGTSTTTSPAGTQSIGEDNPKKPIAAICAAHGIPYTATATVAYPQDLKKKVRKALAVDGPSFLHVLVPCPTGWRYPSEKTVELARLAVETGMFILWELEGTDLRKIKVTKTPKTWRPVEDYLQGQGRYRHLFKPTKRQDIIDQIQAEVDEQLKVMGITKSDA